MRHVLAFLIAACVSCVAFATTTLEESLAFLKVASPYDFPADSTVETFKKVNRIAANEGGFTDADFKYLAPLCRFENIKTLDLRFNGLTGAGLREITEKCGSWNSITYIDLGGNRIVDSHLAHLNAFSALEAFNIDFHDDNASSMVTGEFLKALQLPKLVNIWAVGTSLRDEHVRVLMDMPNFESFYFKDTTLSESFLRELSAVKINLALKKWDLRRMKYESQMARACLKTDAENIQGALLQLAYDNGFFDEEAMAFASANHILPLLVPNSDGSYNLYWICKFKPRDEL